jgi:hypothetical protein
MPDELRDEAASGNEVANMERATTLLDRHDLRGDSDDLYEPMIRVDSRWDVSGNAELTER